LKPYEKSYESDSDDEDYNVDFDESKLPPIEIPPGDHKLQSSYNLWYARKGSHRASEYGKSLHFIGRCATVEQWWSLYCHLLRPTELKPYRKLHLFKSGIKPMWEDPENITGGKWILRLRKNKVNRAWENVCMAMLGEQFLVGPEICGIVLSTQYP
jgi:translation initiation factor 4E